MYSNYNLAKLAKYLHLPEAQVRKLAERGDIPGRKVQGEWSFSHDEIHHWLEKRIGLSDDQELVSVEGVLNKNAIEEETVVAIAKLIPEGGIAIPLDARTRDSAIRSMSKLAAGTGLLWDADEMAEALRKREELHPTALDNGVALLHPRRPMSSILGETFLALGISPRGIPFGGGFNNLTDIFFLICSVDDRTHLRVLARLSRVLTAPGFLDQLRQTTTHGEVIALIEETESKLTE